ncbi:MAG: hypothetical protein KAW41_05630 [Candidatus Diapherotrites archaeon]|nr:hypothetical protein [Candidatus Diapherotrites archaeon]
MPKGLEERKLGRKPGFKFPKVEPDKLRPIIKDYLEKKRDSLADGFWTHEDQAATAVRMMVGKLVRDRGLQVSEVTQDHFPEFGMGSALRVFGSKENALKAAGFSDELINTKPAEHDVASIRNAVRLIEGVKGPGDIDEALHNLHRRVFGDSPKRVSYRYLLKLAEEYTDINYRTLYQLFNPKYSRFKDFDKGLKDGIKAIRRHWRIGEKVAVKREVYSPLDRGLLEKRKRASADERKAAHWFNVNLKDASTASVGGLRRGLTVLPLLSHEVRVAILARLKPENYDYRVSFRKGVVGLTTKEREAIRPHVPPGLKELFDEIPLGGVDLELPSAKAAEEDLWEKQRELQRLETQKLIEEWKEELLEEGERQLREKARDEQDYQKMRRAEEEKLERQRKAETWRRLLKEKRAEQEREGREKALEEKKRQRQEMKQKLFEEKEEKKRLGMEAKRLKKQKEEQEREAQKEWEKQQKELQKQKEAAEVVEKGVAFLEESAEGEGWFVSSKERVDRVPLSFLSGELDKPGPRLGKYFDGMSSEQLERVKAAADKNAAKQAAKKAVKQRAVEEQELARREAWAKRQAEMEKARAKRKEEVEKALEAKAGEEARLIKELTEASAPDLPAMTHTQKIYEFGRTHKGFRTNELMAWLEARDPTISRNRHGVYYAIGRMYRNKKELSKTDSVYTFTPEGERSIKLHEGLKGKRTPETMAERIFSLVEPGVGYSSHWLIENLSKHYKEDKDLDSKTFSTKIHASLHTGLLFERPDYVYFLTPRGVENRKPIASVHDLKEALGEPPAEIAGEAVELEIGGKPRRVVLTPKEKEILGKLRGGFEKKTLRFVATERFLQAYGNLIVPEVEKLALKFLRDNPTAGALETLRVIVGTMYADPKTASAGRIISNVRAELAKEGIEVKEPAPQKAVAPEGPSATEEELWAEIIARQKEEEKQKKKEEPKKPSGAGKPGRAKFGEERPPVSLKDLPATEQYNLAVQARNLRKKFSPSQAVRFLAEQIEAKGYGKADAVRIAKEILEKEKQ